MAKAEFYTYVHRRPNTGEVFYVGKGSGQRAWQFRGRSRHWYSIVAKHGFVVEIARGGLQEWAAFEHEQELIALYGRKDCGQGPLVNTTDGGDGPSGTIFSDALRSQISERQRGDCNVSKRADVREKLAASATGDQNPMKSAETQKKVSAANTGKRASEETRKRMSDAHKGKVFSAETRAKIGASRMGEKHHLFGKPFSDEYRRKISEGIKLSYAKKRAAILAA